MKKLPSLKTPRPGLTPPQPAAPALEMRVIDPRKLGQALKRFCTGKLVQLDDGGLLPGHVMPGGRPVFAR